MKTYFPLAITLLFALLVSGTAYAIDITGCQTISAAGTYDLQNDIINYYGICFVIEADDVVLNLGGHNLVGSFAGGNAVYMPNDQSNITIRNGNISFAKGSAIYLLGACTNCVIDSITVSESTTGIFTRGLLSQSQVTNNTVSKTFSTAIMLVNVEDSTISGNKVTQSYSGLGFGTFTGANTVTGNFACYNKSTGSPSDVWCGIDPTVFSNNQCDSGAVCGGNCNPCPVMVCGDGIAEPYEECGEPGLSCGAREICFDCECVLWPSSCQDDGPNGICPPGCSFNTPYSEDPDCHPLGCCGDGIVRDPNAVNFTEECDDGSAPTEISTCQDLQNIQNDLSSGYILVSDIDCDVAPFNVGAGFNPIGDSTTPFSGILDGRGFKISNLFINRPEEDYVGLIGELAGSTPAVMNIGLENVDIIGRDYVGAIVGRAGDPIVDSYSTGQVSGRDRVGGLVGHAGMLTHLYNSYSSADVTGRDSVGGVIGSTYASYTIRTYSTGNVTGNRGVGGIVGYGGTLGLFDCYSTGTISGLDFVGGVIGDQQGGSIQGCFSTGTVNGTGIGAGGLTGRTEVDWREQSISNSYSTAAINGNGYVGGLIGYLDNALDIFQHCYAANSVSGNSDVGGLIGKCRNSGDCDIITFEQVFWDSDLGPATTAENLGEGKTTAEMQNQATFSQWNFFVTWTIPGGYPYLQWLDESFMYCGDGACNGLEECHTCTADCGACPAGIGSLCPGSCQADCTCPPTSCGNGVIDSGEDCDIGVDGMPGNADDVDVACPGSCQADCTCPPPVPSCSSLTAVPGSDIGPFTSGLTALFDNISDGTSIDFDCGNGVTGSELISSGSASFDCDYLMVAAVTNYTASAIEPVSGASCTANVTVNPPVVPAPSEFQIVSFVLDPNPVTVALPVTVEAKVEVVNLGAGLPDCVVDITVKDLSGVSKATDAVAVTQSVGSSPVPFTIPFTVDSGWVPANYEVIATASKPAAAVPDSRKTKYLNVLGAPETAAVPELSLLVLPLLLAIVLFILKKK